VVQVGILAEFSGCNFTSNSATESTVMQLNGQGVQFSNCNFINNKGGQGM